MDCEVQQSDPTVLSDVADGRLHLPDRIQLEPFDQHRLADWLGESMTVSIERAHLADDAAWSILDHSVPFCSSSRERPN